MNEAVTMFCDGSYHHGSLRGGWAFVLFAGRVLIGQDFGGFRSVRGRDSVSSHDAEVLALAKGLRLAAGLGAMSVLVLTDSHEVLHALSQTKPQRWAREHPFVKEVQATLLDIKCSGQRLLRKKSHVQHAYVHWLAKQGSRRSGKRAVCRDTLSLTDYESFATRYLSSNKPTCPWQRWPD